MSYTKKIDTIKKTNIKPKVNTIETGIHPAMKEVCPGYTKNINAAKTSHTTTQLPLLKNFFLNSFTSFPGVLLPAILSGLGSQASTFIFFAIFIPYL